MLINRATGVLLLLLFLSTEDAAAGVWWTIADAGEDWVANSGNQGGGGWTYRRHNPERVPDVPFDGIAQQLTRRGPSGPSSDAWFIEPNRLRINLVDNGGSPALSLRPNSGPNNDGTRWAVARWDSDATGVFRVNGGFRKLAQGPADRRTQGKVFLQNSTGVTRLYDSDFMRGPNNPQAIALTPSQFNLTAGDRLFFTVQNESRTANGMPATMLDVEIEHFADPEIDFLLRQTDSDNDLRDIPPVQINEGQTVSFESIAELFGGGADVEWRDGSITWSAQGSEEGTYVSLISGGSRVAEADATFTWGDDGAAFAVAPVASDLSWRVVESPSSIDNVPLPSDYRFDVEVLNVAPTPTGIDEPTHIKEGDTASFTLRATDPGFRDILDFYVNDQLVGSDPTPGDGERSLIVPQTYLDDGFFLFDAEVRDRDSGRASFDPLQVVVKNVAPMFTAAPSDQVLEVNEVRQLTAAAFDPGVLDVLAFRWDLDGDGSFGDASGAAVPVAFGDFGNLTLGVEVTDGDGGRDLHFFQVAILSPGDYNKDGAVDPQDYLLWRQLYGTNDLRADGNLDGVVDSADYTVWRDNLGNQVMLPTPTLVSTPTPEPEAARCLLVGLAALLRRRRSGCCLADSC